MRTDGPRGVRRLASRGPLLNGRRAVRGAALVMLTAVMPLLVASSLCSGDDEFPPIRSDWDRIKGHSGPAWGRTDAGAVIVFGWHEGLPRTGGSLYMIGEDGTGLALLSESVGDYTWTDNGVAYDSSPAISPDGTRLLYATKRYPYELFHIATTTLEEQERVLGLFGGGREHRRLRPGRESQAAPAWSPDGTRIALLLDGNLHTMAADGSDPRSIAPGISGIYEPPAWSPDGTRLAFRGSARSWREVSLYVVDADGSNLTLISDGAEGAPAWSPDGTRIAFVQDGSLHPMPTDGSDVLYIFEVENGALTKIIEGPFGPLLWSPADEVYGLRSSPVDPDGRLFAVSVDGPPRIRRVAQFVNEPLGLAWSPAGTRLAVRQNPLLPCGNLATCPHAGVVLFTVAPDGSDMNVLVRIGPGGELVAEGEAGP